MRSRARRAPAQKSAAAHTLHCEITFKPLRISSRGKTALASVAMKMTVQDKLALTSVVGGDKAATKLRNELESYITNLSKTNRSAAYMLRLNTHGHSLKLPEGVAAWLSDFERRVGNAMLNTVSP